MNRQKNNYAFLITAIIVMVFWLIFVKGFATFDQKEFIAIYQIDKLFHLLGGAFIAGVVIFLRGEVSAVRLLLYVFLAALLWESVELLIDPTVVLFFARHRALWVEDTVLDMVAGLVGGLVYWTRVVGVCKRHRQSETIANAPLRRHNAERRQEKTDRKARILRLFDQQDRVTNNDVERLLGVSDATAERYLQELEEEGEITQHGKPGLKSVFYSLNG